MARARAERVKHGVTVKPVRVFVEHETLRLSAAVLRTVGYRYVCRCGERGRVWPSSSKARAEGRWHAG